MTEKENETIIFEGLVIPERDSNADLKIWQYLRLHMKLIYAEDFTLKHLLLFEMCAREICEKFVYKHTETIKYVKK